jgi:hypothetical protein
MTENVTVVTEDPTPTTKRFNTLKAVKIAAIAATAAGVVLYAKSKLNSSVDGQVNVTVETDPQS